MKLQAFYVAIFLLLLSVKPSFAQSPSITNGLNWLSANQQSDGSWGSIADTVLVDTSEVVIAKSNFGIDAGMQNAAAWLTAQDVTSVDEISRKIISMSRMGVDTSSLVTSLISARTSEIGWGYKEGYSSTPFDTSLALQALKSANYPDLTVINPALAFLTTSQNLDGGWGFYKGDESNVYMTAVVSATLQQFPQMTTIAAAVGKATSFLLSHQNPDGGFGSSPSTVYETALAYAALAAVSSNTAVLGNAVTYLTANQAANGSWNDDPYSTALALKALYLSGNKPSPPPPPPAGGTIGGTVMDAVTNQRLGGVAVVLESNNLITTVTDTNGAFTLKDVPPGSQKVDFALTGYAPASASAFVSENVTVALGAVPMVSSHSTGTISGTITDSSGKPLADVAVTVGGAWSGSATTGADGSYSIVYVTPGQVTLSAAKTGFLGVTAAGTVYARTTLSFSPRLSTTASTVTTGTLVGRVVDSYWGLPISPLPGEPGVTVTLSGGIRVTPDDRGYFTIQGLTPNTYQATVGMPGFASQTFRVVISSGVTTDLGTVRLAMTVSKMTMTGKVADASTGASIPGAEVVVAGTALTGRADFAGTYVIADIDHPSEFTLKASATGYTGKSYIVRSAPWIQTMDITLTPQVITGSLTGTVVDASSGQPLSGVTLALVGDPSARATTDSAGTFTFNAVPKGAQQVTLSSSGYATRTLTTAIIAGAVNNVGKITLSVNPVGASVRGTVWDAAANAPFAGVQVQVSGTGLRQTVTAADGTYRLDDVSPGTVTVAATAAAKPGYYGARFSGALAPGGILVFSPALSTTPPALVNVTIATDKPIYNKGDTVGISLNIRNTEAAAYPAALHVRVTDSSGASIFETSVDLNLPADGTIVQNLSFALPATAMGGAYSTLADVYDTGGRMLGTASKSFGVAVSQISVTPTLPAAFAAGTNAVSFSLTNTGNLPVSAGALAVTLKDPDGQVVSTASQTFSLGLGESKTLTYTISIPALKFGAYTLSYLQSDETRAGQEMALLLPNTIAVAPVLDKPSYRVRETADLTITLSNTGKFNLNNSTGSAVAVTVSVPDAGYSETKTLSPAPGVSSATGSILFYHFAIPETVTAGQHNATVTVILPSGSTTAKSTQLTIPESSLSLSPIQAAYKAGETIRPVIANSGGVDTPVLYRLRLYDAKAALIAEKSNTETAVAGSSLSLALAIPSGAVDGAYNLMVNYKDLKTGKEGIIPNPITITGVKGSLTVRTDKQMYSSTESVSGLSTVTNSGAMLQGGNLHLQVTTAGGNLMQKTWHSQYDFQQGVRSGVDTYGVNDWLIPDDDFERAAIDADRWTIGGNVSVVSGKALVDSSTVESYLKSNWQLDGDLDIQVDFTGNNSVGRQGAEFVLQGPSYWVFVRNSSQEGNLSAVQINGSTYSSGGNGGYTTSGKLRITRTGNNISTYYWNGSNWIQLVTISNNVLQNPGNVRLWVWRGDGNPNSSAMFDNFKVNSGRIVIKNETVDSVRLLPLNDNFDSGILNQDRWYLWGNIYANEANGAFHLRSTDTSIWHSIRHRVPFAGNYTAVTQYKNFVSTRSTSDSCYFNMLAYDGTYYSADNAFYIMRISGSSGEQVQGASYLNSGASYFYGSPLPYSSDSGLFRLRRVGTSGFTDYWNGAQWVNVYSENRMSSPDHFIEVYTLASSSKSTVDVDVVRFYTDSGKYAASGTLNLKHDSGTQNNNWGNIQFSSDQPLGTSIKFRTRTAESEAGLTSSIWSNYIIASGSTISSPPGRWIEIEAALATTDRNQTPLLNGVTVTYGNNAGDIVWQTDVPVNQIQGTVSTNLINAIGTLGITGKLYLQGTLTSATGQALASAEYPFYVEQGNWGLLLAADKKIYKPGETVAISGEVKNFATVDAANLALIVTGKPIGGAVQTIYTESFNVPAGGSHPFTATAVAGAEGTVALAGTVVLNGSTRAQVSDQYEVALPKLTASVSGPDVAGNDPFTVSLRLTNSGKTEATVTVGKSFTTLPETVKVAAGQTRLLQYPQQITADASYTFTMTGDMTQTLTKTVAYLAPIPQNSVSAKIVEDKIAYNPNEQVTITATVTNPSTNSIMGNLSARITVINYQGQAVYSETASISTLIPGQTIPIKKYWNTAANPAGAYSVNLQVSSGTTVLSTSTGTFKVLGSSQTPAGLGAGLKGSIVASINPVDYGKDEILTYSVTNIGNEALNGLVLNVIIANPDTQQIVQNYNRAVTLPQNGSVSDIVTVPTSSLPLRAYIAVLQVISTNVTQAKTLSSATFIVKDSIPPVTTITVGTPKYETPGKVLITAGTLFTLTATDDASGVAKTEYRIDGGIWTGYMPFSIATEGSHLVEYRSTDRAGNVEITKSFAVTVDNTPPVSLATFGSSQYSANGNLYVSGSTGITLTATDNASGVRMSEYSIDGAPFVTYSAPFTLTAYPEGSHTIAYRSTDNLGNQEKAKQLAVILDKTPPKTAIAGSDSLVEGVVNTVSPVTSFTLTATDSLSGVRNIWYRIDGGQWQLFTAGFTLAGLNAGAHAISFHAVDNVGNEEAEQAITVRLIVFDVKKGISLDPVVLVGPLKDDNEDEEDGKKAKTDPLVTVLDTLGVAYYTARDEKDFKLALRSGRYNVYLLRDKGKEEAGKEMREGVYYGDGLIYIKTRPDNDDDDRNGILGVRFTGKSTNRDLTLTLPESPLGPADILQTAGRTAVATVTSATASIYGTVSDRKDQYPAIVYNKYGRGGVLLFTFNLLNLPDKTKATQLLANALNLVKPKEHYLRAQDSVPVTIDIVNSTEPFGLEVDETMPVTTTADTITSAGTKAANIITWLHFLGASEKAKFGYYLNLPDAGGDYKVTTETKYANYGNYRLYDTHDMVLKVESCSADLLQGIISDLLALPACDKKDRKRIAQALSQLLQVRQTVLDSKGGEENIETITEALEEVAELSIDAKEVRIKLDELLKIWQRKWYLLKSAEKKDRTDD